MEYYIFAKPEQKKTKLRLRPQIKNAIYKALTGSIIGLYCVGILLGIDYQTAVDVGVWADVVAFGISNGMEFKNV